MEYVVEMKEIRKAFAGIVVNDNITLQLRQGEIHALLGENGAGKSTLMSILFGLYQPDDGTISVRGKQVRITSPRVATDLGIGMVHQHFKLVHNFTVTDNIILGLEPQRWGIVSTGAAVRRIQEISLRYGLNVDPDAKIEDITVGMQQRVEILKMLYRNADVLILDEPTAVLTPQEVAELMKIMKSLTAEGKSIILITHKLKEIKAVADRCTVIRRGQYIGTVTVAGTSAQELAEMMVGRKVSLTVDKAPLVPGAAALTVDKLTVLSNRQLAGLKNFSLTVHAGEILGLAGVDGNGQTELVEAIAGLRPVASGRIELNGVDITFMTVKERIQSGLAHVPADRQKRGLVLDYTLAENMVLELYDCEPFARHGLLRREIIDDYAQTIMTKFDVRAGQGIMTSARTLSGGNQQKAVIGREIGLDPKVLLAVQPTRGLDVGSIEFIHKQLVARRNAGNAVLLVSLELDEILQVADRIAVISSGELIGIVNAADTNENELGLMMTGIGKEREEYEQAKR